MTNRDAFAEYTDDVEFAQFFGVMPPSSSRRSGGNPYWAMPNFSTDADTVNRPVSRSNAHQRLGSLQLQQPQQHGAFIEDAEDTPGATRFDKSFVFDYSNILHNNELVNVSTIKRVAVPRLNACDFANGSAIGEGGSRGSRVYRIHPEDLQFVASNDAYAIACRAEAHKVYPERISPDEIAFTETALSIRNFARLHPRVMEGVIEDGFHHLILPEAIVLHQKRERGLLMPLFDISLKQFLAERAVGAGAAGLQQQRLPQQQQLQRGAARAAVNTNNNDDDDDDGDDDLHVFCSKVAFPPIQSTEATTAILYQLLQAVALLNENLPHSVEAYGAVCSGYTHNDIHLDNIMLMKATGLVALCDFELVGHNPCRPIVSAGQVEEQHKRLPPFCRTPPAGICTPNSDTWALGLIAVNLLTGIDPLFNNAAVVNDFGSGPLLMAYNDPQRGKGISVLDWQANIESHVTATLRLNGATITPAVKSILDFCGKCLVNAEDREPLLASDLLNLDLFEPFRNEPGLAEDLVREWIVQDERSSYPT